MWVVFRCCRISSSSTSSATAALRRINTYCHIDEQLTKPVKLSAVVGTNACTEIIVAWFHKDIPGNIEWVWFGRTLVLVSCSEQILPWHKCRIWNAWVDNFMSNRWKNHSKNCQRIRCDSECGSSMNIISLLTCIMQFLLPCEWALVVSWSTW
jgi:hypothetical protein